MDSRVTRRTFTIAGALAIAGCVSPGPGGGELDIHHLDVGQADSTIIQTDEDETMVIDTGFYEQSAQAVIDYLGTLGVTHLDHLVATHSHADHIGGHADLINYFEEERDGVGTIYDSGIPHTAWFYKLYMDAVEKHDKELVLVKDGQGLPIAGETQALVLNPPSNDGEDLNNNSVCLRINHGGTGYLTTGDAESKAEQRMVSNWGGGLNVDLYQVGHHGSNTSSTESFVDAVDPDTGIISSGYDNTYGYPHDEVLQRFADYDIETYWTGVHEDTIATVDGGVTIEPDEEFSTDPLDIMESVPDASDVESPPSAPDVPDGRVTLVVDRIEDGRGALIPETGDGVAREVRVPATSLPDTASEGSVLSATVENGSVESMQVDRVATARRRRTASERMEDLSVSLDDR